MLLKVIKDLIWGVYCKEKFKKVLEETHPPKNIAGLELDMVNTDVWRKLSNNTKSNYLRYQNLQNLILKSKNLTCKLIDAFYKVTEVTDTKELQHII